MRRALRLGVLEVNLDFCWKMMTETSCACRLRPGLNFLLCSGLESAAETLTLDRGWHRDGSLVDLQWIEELVVRRTPRLDIVEVNLG